MISSRWGKTKSWNGSWSNNSTDWNIVSESIKQKLNVRDQTDGQFFISFEDFYRQFTVIDFVHINMNAVYDHSNKRSLPVKWVYQVHQGEWIPGINAGGYFSSFLAT
jgi:hypothetical protein